MGLKLIGAALSPFVRKVRVVLAEKGLSYEHDPMLPFNVSEEYRRLHPMGKIPTLLDGERVIPDSSAICAYLERIQPEPALYPSDPYAYARALWYEEYADTALVEGLIVPFQERLLAPTIFKRETDRPRIERTLGEQLPPAFDYLERALGAGEWLAGEAFGIADIAVGTQFVNFAHGGESVDPARWPRLAAHVERVHARPSFRALIDEERKLIEAMRR